MLATPRKSVMTNQVCPGGSRHLRLLYVTHVRTEGKWKLLHGIFQARILEWVAFLFSMGSSQPRSPALQVDSLPAEPQEKPRNTGVSSLSLPQWIFPTQELSWGLLHGRLILWLYSRPTESDMLGWGPAVFNFTSPACDLMHAVEPLHTSHLRKL